MRTVIARAALLLAVTTVFSDVAVGQTGHGYVLPAAACADGSGRGVPHGVPQPVPHQARCATQPPCPPPTPCPPPPKPPDGPPRMGPPFDEFPPVAPGAYAAPPRSGMTMGELRGGQLGGLRIRFPELVIGLPQIEWTGHSRFTRSSHMRLDEAVAPFVANPHYEAAIVARELERRQWRVLEEEQARRDQEARAPDRMRDAAARDEKDEELARLRECERVLREQLCEMQHQLQLLHSRLPPPKAGPERVPAPRPMPPNPLPCPQSKDCPTSGPPLTGTRHDGQPREHWNHPMPHHPAITAGHSAPTSPSTASPVTHHQPLPFLAQGERALTWPARSVFEK